MRGSGEASEDGAIEAHVPLPTSLKGLPGGGREQARASFNAAAALYDRGRPGYPRELFADLASRAGLTRATRVLEIGCGTGQATRFLAEHGCPIHCVELGSELAAIARDRLSRFDNVQVETSAFETAELPPESVDLVFSATAFHWIDPSLAFPRAAQALTHGGFLALATNAHVLGGTQDEIAADIQHLQSRIAPEVGPWKFPTAAAVAARAQAGGDIAAVWSRVDRCFFEPPDVRHLFLDPVVTTYEWIAEYDADGYLAMLGTQSTYLLLESAQREALFAQLGSLIQQRLNGRVTKAYLAVLATAQRR